MKVKNILHKVFHAPGKLLTYFILMVCAVFVWVPIYMAISGTFMGSQEIKEHIGTVLEQGTNPVNWPLLPLYPTLQPYIELLCDSPKFFVMFWNSCKQVITAVLGQLLVGIPAAWSFAKFRYPGRKVLYRLYIALMILPFQVTMVSSYLVLNHMNLLDTHFAIILPAVFSTFPVFIMEKFFRAIPEELMESAKMDGAGTLDMFLRIGIPLGKSGIISAIVLSFLELWNAIEQPMTFLRVKSFWPLSLYLPQIASDQVGLSFIASMIMMMPALLLFLKGQGYLEQGIVASGIKE